MEIALLAAKRNGVSPFNDDKTRSQYGRFSLGSSVEQYDKLREQYEKYMLSPERLPDIESLFNVIEMVNSGTEG